MTAPRIRAGDNDRQAAVDRLGGHFTAGRLTADEYDERIQNAYAATYLDEFSGLFADLPRERVVQPGGWRPGAAGAAFAQSRPGAPTARRRRVGAVLPVIALALFLIAITHGFILLPVLWVAIAMLVVGRRHRRIEPAHPGHRR